MQTDNDLQDYLDEAWRDEDCWDWTYDPTFDPDYDEDEDE